MSDDAARAIVIGLAVGAPVVSLETGDISYIVAAIWLWCGYALIYTFIERWIIAAVAIGVPAALVGIARLLAAR